MDGNVIFSAVSTSVRQLYLLLRCISFTPKAQVQITSNGIRFTVDEARVVQGLTLLDKNLFTSYDFNPPDDIDKLPHFEISLPALLETLQIFGVSETAASSRHAGGGFSSSHTNAFAATSLAIGGTCRLSYAEVGSPLCITIQEGQVTTTCELNTYEVRDWEDDDGLPFDASSICLKTIMRSSWLHDAITELSGTNPEAVVVNASERSQPYFALEGEDGPFGDVTIDYLPESKTDPTPTNMPRTKKQPLVTERFSVTAPAGMHGRLKQRYKFDLLKKASRAMALASKVSIRVDASSVMSLQFMIELGGQSNSAQDGSVAAGDSGRAVYVDFRFVALIDDGDDQDDYVSGEGEGSSAEQ